ncbi:hypothetical protein C7M84_000175 [Penaeus vannamei]|uniref:Uncharacterized protein n=1 Tax=Penaeus vannamei TaxID=6689 RepID=A0A423TX93_PENVA|nr:hypothetical protein C7M84_000175 [Penaeus vannamei]
MPQQTLTQLTKQNKTKTRSISIHTSIPIALPSKIASLPSQIHTQRCPSLHAVVPSLSSVTPYLPALLFNMARPYLTCEISIHVRTLPQLATSYKSTSPVPSHHPPSIQSPLPQIIYQSSSIHQSIITSSSNRSIDPYKSSNYQSEFSNIPQITHPPLSFLLTVLASQLAISLIYQSTRLFPLFTTSPSSVHSSRPIILHNVNYAPSYHQHAYLYLATYVHPNHLLPFTPQQDKHINLRHSTRSTLQFHYTILLLPSTPLISLLQYQQSTQALPLSIPSIHHHPTSSSLHFTLPILHTTHPPPSSSPTPTPLTPPTTTTSLYLLLPPPPPMPSPPPQPSPLPLPSTHKLRSHSSRSARRWKKLYSLRHCSIDFEKSGQHVTAPNDTAPTNNKSSHELRLISVARRHQSCCKKL